MLALALEGLRVIAHLLEELGDVPACAAHRRGALLEIVQLRGVLLRWEKAKGRDSSRVGGAEARREGDRGDRGDGGAGGGVGGLTFMASVPPIHGMFELGAEVRRLARAFVVRPLPSDASENAPTGYLGWIERFDQPHPLFGYKHLQFMFKMSNCLPYGDAR